MFNDNLREERDQGQSSDPHYLSLEILKQSFDYFLCLWPLFPLLSSKNRNLIMIPLV